MKHIPYMIYMDGKGLVDCTIHLCEDCDKMECHKVLERCSTGQTLWFLGVDSLSTWCSFIYIYNIIYISSFRYIHMFV